MLCPTYGDHFKSGLFCAIGWRCSSGRSPWTFCKGCGASAGHRLLPLRKIVRAKQCGQKLLSLQRQGAAELGYRRHAVWLVRLRCTVLRSGAGKVALVWFAVRSF